MTAEDRERLVRIETQLAQLVADLRGNGQPGRCAVHEHRISRLERWRSRAAGAIWAIGVMAGSALTLGAALLAAMVGA